MWKNRIIHLLFSVSILVVWFFLFMNAKRPGYFGVLIGLIYTFYGNIYFKNNENKTLKVLKYVAPLFYLVMSFIMIRPSIWLLINPILVGFTTLFISDLFKKEELKVINFILPITYFYIYAFTIFPIWERTTVAPPETYNFEKQNNEIDSVLLYEFQFLNSDFDTIKLNTDKDFIIIESWNETCVPCLKAMDELPPFYDSISNRFDQYYMYESIKKSIDF